MTGYFRFEPVENRNALQGRVHYHNTWEIYCLTEGQCRYFIDSRTYRLVQGDIVVIPPNVIHNVIYESERHSRILINCSQDHIPPSVVQKRESLVYFRQTAQTVRQISALYHRLRGLPQDEFYADSARCLVMDLLLTMARASADASEPKTGCPFVEKAVLYIRDNYMDRLTLTRTAAHCAVSPEHLSRTFKKETGFCFNEYLNIYRLKRAQTLLRSGSNSVRQVAMLCGFSDSNYFSGAYKRMYGIPPSQEAKEQ